MIRLAKFYVGIFISLAIIIMHSAYTVQR